MVLAGTYRLIDEVQRMIWRRLRFGKFVMSWTKRDCARDTECSNSEVDGGPLPSRSVVSEIVCGSKLTIIQAARSYGCRVDTITLSAEQKKLAERRIKDAGLEDKITVHLQDYRELPPEFEKQFDSFISIEMLEVRFSSINFQESPAN